MAEWISVEDRMPEKDGYYLVVIDDTGISIEEFSKEKLAWLGFDWENAEVFELIGITHWMPLPEPPEEVNGDA